MEIWPAIDLLGGKAVRLTKGDYEQVTVYFERPEEILEYFERVGASHLHVVDLDGARDGEMVNYETIRRLCENSRLQIEVGGGIRTEERIKAYLDLGVSQVILGTAAAEDTPFLRRMVERYQKQIVVGVDAKAGRVALHGWKDVSDIDAPTFCKELENLGVSRIIYTDIARDGGLSGTNLPLYKQLSTMLHIDLIASGGITYLEEIKELRDYGLTGAIVGKAVYEGKLDLAQVLAIGEDTHVS